MAEAKTPKMVTIKFPLTKHDKEDIYVAVNGKSYQIKRGENVTIPDYVLKVIENQEEAIAQAMAFEAEAQKAAKTREELK